MFTKNMLRTPKDRYQLRKHKGHFGLEIEIEGQNWPAEEIPGWCPHIDNSVPNGMEFATEMPHDIPGIISMMEELHKAFAKAKTQTRLSYRASTHLHYNVQSCRFIDVIGFVILFTLIEPVFLRLCGPDRDGNLFCLPSYDTGDFHLYFSQLLRHVMNLDETNFPPRGKYASLNLSPLEYQGSVEFRVFPSTLDIHRVVQWCEWIERIMGIVKAQDDLTFRELYLTMKHEPMKILNKIFNPVELESACHPTLVYDLVGVGNQNGHELRRVLSMYMKGYDPYKESE